MLGVVSQGNHPSPSQQLTYPVANQLPFELRDRRKDTEHQPSIWRGGVHAFVQADEWMPGASNSLRAFTSCRSARGPAYFSYEL